MVTAPAVAQGTGEETEPAVGLGQIEAPTGSRPGAPPVLAPIDAITGILVLNQDRFLAQSLYGRRIGREVEVASAELSAENRMIEGQLMAEELSLTEQRQSMDPSAFRELAVEFDTRVEAIRTAQEAKGRSIQTQAETARTRFFELAFPVLLDIVEAREAAVLLDSRTVLLVADTVDITDEAIAAVDAALGDGGPAPLVEMTGAGTPEPRP